MPQPLETIIDNGKTFSAFLASMARKSRDTDNPKVQALVCLLYQVASTLDDKNEKAKSRLAALKSQGVSTDFNDLLGAYEEGKPLKPPRPPKGTASDSEVKATLEKIVVRRFILERANPRAAFAALHRDIDSAGIQIVADPNLLDATSDQSQSSGRLRPVDGGSRGREMARAFEFQNSSAFLLLRRMCAVYKLGFKISDGEVVLTPGDASDGQEYGLRMVSARELVHDSERYEDKEIEVWGLASEVKRGAFSRPSVFLNGGVELEFAKGFSTSQSPFKELKKALESGADGSAGGRSGGRRPQPRGGRRGEGGESWRHSTQPDGPGGGGTMVQVSAVGSFKRAKKGRVVVEGCHDLSWHTLGPPGNRR